MQQVIELLDLTKMQGMTQLVFDLRNNPGGPLDAAVGETCPRQSDTRRRRHPRLPVAAAARVLWRLSVEVRRRRVRAQLAAEEAREAEGQLEDDEVAQRLADDHILKTERVYGLLAGYGSAEVLGKRRVIGNGCERVCKGIGVGGGYRLALLSLCRHADLGAGEVNGLELVDNSHLRMPASARVSSRLGSTRVRGRAAARAPRHPSP